MNDPYLYSNSNVLKNKYNLKNETEINKMEVEFSSLRIKELETKPIIGNFDFKHLCEIHKYIFQDIYEWAGTQRTINIEKSESVLGGISIEYEEFYNIENAAERILADMKSSELHTTLEVGASWIKKTNAF